MTDGERWTREAIAELRAARFGPRGWARFLAASFERASSRRTAHRLAHRQILALAGVGAAAWSAVAVGGEPALALGGAAWLALLLAMVDWHLGMLESPAGRPRDGLGLGNAVSVARGSAIPAFFAVGPTGLVVAMAMAGALDVLDGALARRLGERTRLGAWLDGSLDSTSAVAVAIAAFRLDAIPRWLVLLVLLRVALPWLALTYVYFVRAAPAPVRPALRSPGLAARLPGLVAAVGLGLSLTGSAVGVALATAGITASIAHVGVLASSTWRDTARAPRPARGHGEGATRTAALRSGSRRNG